MALTFDLQSAGNAGEYYTPRAVTAFMVDRKGAESQGRKVERLGR